MVIGVALAILLSTILFIIDRNHAWPQTWNLSKRVLKISGRIFLVVVAVGLVTWGVFIALAQWRERKSAKLPPPAMTSDIPAPTVELPAPPNVIYGTPAPPAQPVPPFGNGRINANHADLCGENSNASGYGDPLDVLTTVSYPMRVKVLRGNQYWYFVRLPNGRQGYTGVSNVQLDEGVTVENTP
jgi:hypothetical protein